MEIRCVLMHPFWAKQGICENMELPHLWVLVRQYASTLPAGSLDKTPRRATAASTDERGFGEPLEICSPQDANKTERKRTVALGPIALPRIERLRKRNIDHVTETAESKIR